MVLKVWPLTSRNSIAWALIRNTGSQAPALNLLKHKLWGWDPEIWVKQVPGVVLMHEDV